MIRYRKSIALLSASIALLASALMLMPAAANTIEATKIIKTPKPKLEKPTPVLPPITSLYAVGNLGQIVTIEGTIVRESHYSVGYRLWLSNPQGMAILNIHDEDYPFITNLAGLGNGAQVRITGKVWKPYRDVYQVVPRGAGDVSVLTPAVNFTTRARHYDLGGLSGNDHAAMMVVQGEVIGVQPCVVYGIDPRINLDPADPAVCITVRDATGAQYLALPIVASQQVNKLIYKIGNQIKAYGQLRGKPKQGIQIYVALPADIAVAN